MSEIAHIYGASQRVGRGSRLQPRAGTVVRMANQSQMEYRRLGNTGVKVSVLSFGSWVNSTCSSTPISPWSACRPPTTRSCNFFDNAEAYAGGKSEEIMGKALAQLGWPRSVRGVHQVLLGHPPRARNMSNTLNRKYLIAGDRRSLERCGLDYVDLVYCHRARPEHARSRRRCGR